MFSPLKFKTHDFFSFKTLYASNLYEQPLAVDKITPIEQNLEARAAYERYYGRTNSFTAKALRRIKRTLKGDFGA